MRPNPWRNILLAVLAAVGFFIAIVVGFSNPYIGLAIGGFWTYANWRWWHVSF